MAKFHSTGLERLAKDSKAREYLLNMHKANPTGFVQNLLEE